jgi:1-pyrroline-5-carboxylate dehydrogenase
MSANQKITYTTTNVDMTAFHAAFDEGLAKARAGAGQTHPAWIGGEAVEGAGGFIDSVSPVDTDVLLGRFHACQAEQVEVAVKAARGATKGWRNTPWRERVRVVRRAAALIRERKFELAAIMSLEVGKSRLESMGDAEESADLLDYYCQQMEDHGGYVTKMNNPTAVETNTDVLRPFGVFACIAPFNFPLALSCGMSSAALVAGNTVIYKPAKDTPWIGLKLYEVYRDAGVPAGVFNFLTGRGADLGDSLALNPGVDGVVFTGSKQVGMHIYHGMSKDWIKPCLLELGGKNAAIVMPSADLDKAAEGVMKSAWGLQNQKCSACSRVYVHRDVADAFLDKLLALTRDIVIGDPTEAGVYFGPVINAGGVKTWEAAVAQARREGELLCGGERLTAGKLAKGHYVAPTVAKLPLDSRLFMEELFVPFLSVGIIESLDEALAWTNKAEYGLTAGIFSGEQAEIDQFFDEVEAGVLYVNKRTGATTGAWPGAQSFTGWKGSGSSGKGGCGPYYVAQFMREQSRCVIED